jgi:undecaprenyl diphosphate synthase
LNGIIENTKNNTGMTLTLALSYGGKQEIFKAVKEISEKVKNDIISLDNFDDSVNK